MCVMKVMVTTHQQSYTKPPSSKLRRLLGVSSASGMHMHYGLPIGIASVGSYQHA